MPLSASLAYQQASVLIIWGGPTVNGLGLFPHVVDLLQYRCSSLQVHSQSCCMCVDVVKPV